LIADADRTAELVSYDGVGPKTASCVLLFCLGRDSFAVDTHVFRLSRLLGWVPPRADRVLAQAHLDRRVPDALKYGLHVLMVSHGRACAGCKNAAGRGAPCPLKTYLRERKGVKEERVEDVLEEADDEAKEMALKEEVKDEEVEDALPVIKQEEPAHRPRRSRRAKP
jgi:endonuclease-3